MKFVSHLILFSINLILVTPSLYQDGNDNVMSLLRRSLSKPEVKQILNYKKESKKYDSDPLNAASNQFVYVGSKKHDIKVSTDEFKTNNIFGKDTKQSKPGRRFIKKKKDFSRSSSESSSLELGEWKDQWKELWIKKKFEAINSSRPRGDTVNMLEARPWGVPCGDPQQHDMPWGNCMLPMECDAEYRIYRGDYNCGRSQFVCCALQVHTYDMYQGFDASFADTDIATDSEEKRNRDKGSKERSRSKKYKDRKRRRRDRQKRKRKIKKKIRKIVREMKRILNKSYRNATSDRRKKTKQLKKFVEMLKKEYKKDRYSVQDIHVNALEKIDTALQTKLDQIKIMNNEFLKNSTFRDIIVNGTIDPKIARELLKVYPELSTILNARRSNNKNDNFNDYIDYDIEYGLLYD